MSEIAFIRFVHPVTWMGESQPRLPVSGHEQSTKIVFRDGIFSVSEGTSALEIPLHNVYCFKYATAKAAK